MSNMGGNLSVAPVQRKIASLNSIFNLTKSKNPTKEPLVILTTKKLRRKFGRPQKQADANHIGELSGHSFRVGAALDLLDQGIPLERIMLRGGWKSETTTLRYLRNWDDQNWALIDR